MRILMICPTQEGRTKVGMDIGRAFAGLGHEVEYFDYDGRSPWLRLWPKPLRGPWYANAAVVRQNRALRAAARRTRPDLVFAVKGFALEKETVASIKAHRGAMLAGYWIDDPLDHRRALEVAPAYDVYFTNDARSVPSYVANGIARIHHLPSSADSGRFRRLGRARDLEIAFIGTRTDAREALIGQLRDYPLHVFGPGWPKTSLGGRVRTYPEAHGERTNEIYNRARINLNIHTWVGKGSAVNLRLFEVPAAGAFLLTDWVDEIGDYYREDEHLACYRGVDELRAKLEHYLRHPEECERIAAAGQAHFLARHSYTVRAKSILEKLAA